MFIVLFSSFLKIDHFAVVGAGQKLVFDGRYYDPHDKLKLSKVVLSAQVHACKLIKLVALKECCFQLAKFVYLDLPAVFMPV